MRFGLLYEQQLPRPWTPGDDAALLAATLEQLAVADRIGLHRAWVGGRHFQEERSHSSAPVAVLAAASQRTDRLRLGLGPLALATAIRHPGVLAGEIATLDVLADGRVDLATSPCTVGAEVGAFGVDRGTAVAQWSEQLEVVARLLAERPFTGVDGRHVRMAPRAVVPAPAQAPHPPLWMACGRPEDVRVAAERGLGVLAHWLPEPQEAAEWVREYREVLGSDRCVPCGLVISPAFAVVLPLHVHEDEQEAIDRGIDGAQFDAYAREHYETFGDHRPGTSDLWAEFLERREDVGFSREAVRAEGGPLQLKLLQDGRASLRGAIGTPEQVRELVARYAEAGVDELVFVAQSGRTAPEHVLASLELFGSTVLPGFADAASRADAVPAAAIAAALARRPARPLADGGYAFGPMDEAAASGTDAPASSSSGPGPGPAAARPVPGGQPSSPAQTWRTDRVRTLRTAAQAHGTRALKTFVQRSDDRRLERTVGSSRGLAAVFSAMASRFEPEAAAGFTGDLRYELRGGDGGLRTWTVTCRLDGASAVASARPDPAVTIKLALADFVRLAAGELDPGKALLTGRLDLEGDFAVATRLGEMFGEVG